MKSKQILRHVWEGYKELANNYRYQDDVKKIYTQRSTHIERMKYGLRKTYF